MPDLITAPVRKYHRSIPILQCNWNKPLKKCKNKQYWLGFVNAVRRCYVHSVMTPISLQSLKCIICQDSNEMFTQLWFPSACSLLPVEFVYAARGCYFYSFKAPISLQSFPSRICIHSKGMLCFLSYDSHKPAVSATKCTQQRQIRQHRCTA